MARLSNSPTLYKIAYIFGTCSIAFGFNAIFNPVLALSFFEFDYNLQTGQTKRIVDTMLLVYGVRDVFMGFATMIAAYHKQPKILGLLIMATASIAVADGAICYYIHGTGHWNHLPLAPIIFGVGAVFLGALDSS